MEQKLSLYQEEEESLEQKQIDILVTWLQTIQNRLDVLEKKCICGGKE